MNFLKDKFLSVSHDFRVTVRWIFIAAFIGTVVGLVGVLFHFITECAGEFREEHPVIIWLLPAAGILIAFLYKIFKMENDRGTNLVIQSVNSDEQVRFRTAPLIFIGTSLTHLFGGSAGREGAALQIGSAIALAFKKPFRLDEKDKRILTMCGMSAAFSAVFATPVTAVIFPMEVISVGIMHYSALLPCAVASFTGIMISRAFGMSATVFALSGVPSLSIMNFMKTALLASICAVIGLLFCMSVKLTSRYLKRLLCNPLYRVAAGGLAVAILTFIIGSHDYNGAGMNIIESAFSGRVRPEAFALKIVFTALTLGAGFKGGEIIPTFFVGAAFGNVFGSLIGLSPSYSAGIGLCALFCSVTNSPLTSIILAVELFGSEGLPFFVIAAALSYVLSGYYGLYTSQKIVYSKTKTEFIDTYSL